MWPNGRIDNRLLFGELSAPNKLARRLLKETALQNITAMTEPPMHSQNEQFRSFQRLNLMDTLLYVVAGSAMIFISVTFLLWLRY
jgi:hypothetical protein